METKIGDTILSLFFALWITLTFFLAFVAYNISQIIYLWISIIFAVSFSILKLTVPKILERSQKMPFSIPFKFRYQKCEINPISEEGDTNIKITSRIVNLGKNPMSGKKHTVSLTRGELPEEGTLKAMDEEGNELRHTFYTKSKMYWDFIVEFRSAIQYLKELKYHHSVENVKKMYPKSSTQHQWLWRPVTLIDLFQIEVMYNFEVEILDAKLINMATEGIVGETVPHKRHIVSEVKKLYPGEYKLLWNTK